MERGSRDLIVRAWLGREGEYLYLACAARPAQLAQLSSSLCSSLFQLYRGIEIVEQSRLNSLDYLSVNLIRFSRW